MIYRGFCGPSNPSQSVLADAERTVNWYVERMLAHASPTGAMLYPVPGQSPLYSTTSVGTRAIWSENGQAFAVIGADLWELFADGTSTKRNVAFGAMAQDAYLATISYNQNISTLGITTGGNWYNYDLATNTLTQVAALNGKATMGGYKDGYYLAFNINNSTVYVSALNDGTTWNTGVSFFQRSIASDPLKAMIVGNPLVYLLGEQTSEAWYDQGVNANQPFAPVTTSFMNYGLSAPFAVGLSGDVLVWLARTKVGQDIVVSTRGYDPQPVGGYAIATALGNMRRTSTVDDAEISIYEEDGHTFGVFSFWMAKQTWAMDLETGDLHERGTWIPANMAYDAWHPRVQGFAFGRHLTGERATGIISDSSIAYATDADGTTGMRRLRVGPPLWAPYNKRVSLSRLQLQADVGLGTLSGQGVNPQAMLRVSPDARTWGSQRMCSAGRNGRYNWNVYWTQVGSSPKVLVPELTVSDPIPWRFSACEIDGHNLYQTQKAA